MNRNYHFIAILGLLSFLLLSDLLIASPTDDPIITAVSEDVVLNCNSFNVDEMFSLWITDRGGAEVEGFCSGLTSFAAVPGTYDVADFNTFPGISVGDFDIMICPSPVSGILRQEIVDFVFYDDCDNVLVSTAKFSISDTIVPLISQCPLDSSYLIMGNDCSVPVSIKAPHVVDDCGETEPHIYRTIHHDITAANTDLTTIVDSIHLIFGPFNLSSSPAVSDANFKLSFFNIDGNLNTEFFTVKGEDDTFIGITPMTVTECSDTFIVFTITAAQINSWSMDGYIDFFLFPKITSDPVLAINDICGGSSVVAKLDFEIDINDNVSYLIRINEGEAFEAVLNEDFDTLLTIGEYELTYIFQDCAQNRDSCTSMISITEEITPVIQCYNDTIAVLPIGKCLYDYVLPNDIGFFDNCSIDHHNLHYYTSGATIIGATDIDQNNIHLSLNKGLTKVTLVTFDAFLNADTCEYTVTVVDNELPTITCTNDSIIVIDLTKNDVVVLDLSILRASISDNCNIDSMIIVPATISCDLIGTEVSVELVVWDSAGNKNTCTSLITIQAMPLTPTYLPINCDGDSLALKSNITSSNTSLSYHWTGPNNFESVEPNPIILNPPNEASGSYTLVIENGSCSTLGSVDIIFEILETPSIRNDSSTICIKDSLILFATTYDLDVTYHWYEGPINNRTLLDTTEVNHIVINPSLGVHEYVLIVSNDNCITESSDIITIESIIRPEAKVLSTLDKVCEGDSIYLLSDRPVSSEFMYQWIGPNHHIVQQNPIIPVASLNDEGIYSFVVSKGFCYSDTTDKMIVINETPKKPIISSSGLFCEDSDILLNIINVAFADKFYWVKDDISYLVTNENELIIQDATANLNGKWKVQARLGMCYSDTSFSHEIIIEENLNINIGGPDSACIGDSVRFTSPFIANASYQWSGPGMFSYDQQNPTLSAVGGSYQLNVITENGCSNNASLVLHVDAIPSITAVSNDAITCMKLGEEIQLSASVFPVADYTYLWTGPNGYSSNIENPKLTNVDTTSNGYYRLVIKNAFCNSNLDSTLIDIVNQPLQPSVVIEEEYCYGSDVSLSVVGLSGSAISYIWNTPIGQETTNNPSLMINNISINNIGEYSVQILDKDCPSEFSVPVKLKIRALPESLVIDGENTLCEGASLQLMPNENDLLSYEWKGPNGYIASTEMIIISDFKENNNGAYFIRGFDGKCYSDWSIPKVINLEPLPLAAEFDSVSSSVCLGLEGLISICLDEQTVTSGASYHIYEDLNNSLLGSSSSLCFDIENLDLLQTGINQLYVQTELNGCSSNSNLTSIVQLDHIPTNKAKIEEGDELHFCHDGGVLLSTQVPVGHDILWYSEGALEFKTPNNRTTIVNHLNKGTNQVFLSYSYLSCKDYTTDTIDLYIEDSPMANDDVINLLYNTTESIGILENDHYLTDVNIFIDDAQDIPGTIEIIDDKLEFRPNPGFIGDVSFDYEICNIYCPDKCTSAQVLVMVGDANDCFVANIFTPNGDDINDYFTIPCLSTNAYPKNKLLIFNQWGDTVFEADGYQNDWMGTYNNNPLPSGTYYYVLHTGIEGTDTQKGFLILER